MTNDTSTVILLPAVDPHTFYERRPIGTAVLALQYLGHLTLEQAEDLLQFLLGLTDMDYRTFQTYYQRDTIF